MSVAAYLDDVEIDASFISYEVSRLTCRILNHPFMLRCADGTISVPELRRFLVQHGIYSRYFTRYLCALISALEDGADVLQLAGNLVEELGLGGGHERPHSRIYLDMLKQFGLSLDDHKPNPETRVLIDTIFMLCRQPHGICGLGALYLAAEAIVPAIYSRIVDGFVQNGISGDILDFFLIHVECDEEHSRIMFEMAKRLVRNSDERRTSILSAGDIALNARLRFFDAITETTK